jgi:hypothetical protein
VIVLALYTATACGRSVMPVETSFMQPSSVKQKVIEGLDLHGQELFPHIEEKEDRFTDH